MINKKYKKSILTHLKIWSSSCFSSSSAMLRLSWLNLFGCISFSIWDIKNRLHMRLLNTLLPSEYYNEYLNFLKTAKFCKIVSSMSKCTWRVFLILIIMHNFSNLCKVTNQQANKINQSYQLWLLIIWLNTKVHY